MAGWAPWAELGSDYRKHFKKLMDFLFQQRKIVGRIFRGCTNQQDPVFLCNIDAAFQEAMTAHMGTHAYLEGRTMYWDKDKEEIVRGELA